MKTTNAHCLMLIGCLMLAFTSALGDEFAVPAPESATTALKAALENPPVSARFLADVADNSEVATYLKHYSSLEVASGDLTVVFARTDMVEITVSGMDTGDLTVDLETRDFDCEVSDDSAAICSAIKATMADVAQRQFWEALEHAVTARTAQLNGE